MNDYSFAFYCGSHIVDIICNMIPHNVRQKSNHSQQKQSQNQNHTLSFPVTP